MPIFSIAEQIEALSKCAFKNPTHYVAFSPRRKSPAWLVTLDDGTAVIVVGKTHHGFLSPDDRRVHAAA